GGFEPREAELEILAVKHRPRQADASRDSGVGEARQRRTAGVTEAEELRGLVKGFARGIVLRFSEESVAADSLDSHELGVAAGHEQRNERERGRPLGKKRREKMALQVVESHGRDPQRDTKGVSEGGTHQQSPGEARSRGVTHAAEIVNISLGGAKYLPRQRDEAPDVVAR